MLGETKRWSVSMKDLCKFSIECNDNTSNKYYCKLKKDHNEFINEYCNFADSIPPKQKDVKFECTLYSEATMKEEVKDQTRSELKKIIDTNKISLPNMWLGYLIAIFYFLFEVSNKPNVNEESISSIVLYFIGLSGGIYLLNCIYKIHKYLFIISEGDYPVSPNKAVGFHFIPFYNIFWILKWTNEISNFLIKRKSSKLLEKGWSGYFILIGLFFYYFLNGAIGMAIIFSAVLNIIKKIKALKLSTDDS